MTDAFRAENTKLKHDVIMLNKRINSMEQYSRSSNIEIYDISEKPGKNLVDVVIAIVKAILM